MGLGMPWIQIGFTTLKLLHSYYFYDGLAAQVEETLALWSVVTILVLALIISSAPPAKGGRGLVFGHGTLPADFREFVTLHFHPYACAFGVCFNLWYHRAQRSLSSAQLPSLLPGRR